MYLELTADWAGGGGGVVFSAYYSCYLFWVCSEVSKKVYLHFVLVNQVVCKLLLASK
jgi:hypothetical protein